MTAAVKLIRTASASLIAAMAVVSTARADSVDWSLLGSGNTTTSPYSVVSAGGDTATLTNDKGFMGVLEGNTNGSYWAGNLDAGSLDLFNNYSQQAVAVAFSKAITSVSVQLSTWAYGNYTETLTAYSGANLLGSVSANANDSYNPGTAPVLSYSGSDITNIVLSATNNSNGFAISPITFTAAASVPEPESWALVVVGVGAAAGLAARRRGRRVGKAGSPA